MTQSPPNSLHYAGFANQKTDALEDPLCFVKYNNFGGNMEIETETDQGHTGTRSLNLGEDRTKASASPEIEDKLRPEEGLEDYWYHILGDFTLDTIGTKVKKYTFTPDADGVLPAVSILHGFNYDTEKARGFANALANEMNIKMSASEAPSVSMKYISDFPKYEVTEPTITFLASPPQSFKAGQLEAFMGATTGIVEGTDSMGCLTEAELTISNNIESSVCAGNDLGEVDKDVGELTLEGSFSVKYNNAVAKLEQQWATGASDGTTVTYDSLFKALRFRYTGALIENVGTSPVVPYYYMMQIDTPKVDITSVKNSEGGEGSKAVEVEFKAISSLSDDDIVTAIVQSQLAGLHTTP